MNERIRLLADKIWAEEYWDKPNTDKLLPAQLNRFAELIVRECVAICENNEFPESPDLFEHGWDGGLQAAQERMMNHFGVE